ncbi:MAG: 1-acyl-sn-glycerol-3-phosphate acyltransferase, partial [Alphaproteobacteria bacterium]|nr:1-acyl-sn-glycerol-3-phosphate acyltransferase [Alphaproteobacteria bacterium]
LPMLLMPRKIMMSAVYIFIYTTTFLEKYILGLSYEIRGAENLPEEPPYIIAAKHQSAYETFKLHLLFKDPATILKQELLKIPLWGKYLEKSGVIAIDRSSPKTAIRSMKEGARHVAAQKRPIVIFPQGTRVSPGTGTNEKPYRAGVAHIQKATGLPIIPMATNTGVFYPKGAWLKKPGRVVFEFLPPIEASDERSNAETSKQLEASLEKKSNELMEEAYNSLQEKQMKRNPLGTIFTILTITLFAIYSTIWFYYANMLNSAYENWLLAIKTDPSVLEVLSGDLHISGYPGKIHVSQPYQKIQTFEGTLNIKDINAEGWLFPGSVISLQTGEITLQHINWKKPLPFDFLRADFRIWENKLTIEKTILQSGKTTAILSGTLITPPPLDYPIVNLDILLKDFSPFLLELVSQKIVNQKAAMMASFVFKTLEKEDGLHTSITSQENSLFLGPILFYQFPKNSY